MKKKMTVVAAAIGLLLVVGTSAWAADVIKIGVIFDDRKLVGDNPFEAAEVIRERVNGGGGLKVGIKIYQLEFVYRGWHFINADLEWNSKNAAECASKLITEDKVFAVMGPNMANVVGDLVADICNANEMLNMTYAPSGATDRPWVFVTQGPIEFAHEAMARFAKEDLKAKTAAVLYSIDTVAGRDNAFAFKSAFESINGKGSVVAFETETSQNMRDGKVGPQLKKIVDSQADVFTVTTTADVACNLIRQVKALGYKGYISSGMRWDSPELINPRIDQLRGSYTWGEFVASLATGAGKSFVADFAKKYGRAPERKHAFVWDGLNMLLQAIQNTNGLTGDMKKDRQAVRDQLFKVRTFLGVGGPISFDGKTGNPQKCLYILKIVDRITETGGWELVRTVCP